eukprot:gene4144-8240_t
MLDHISIFTKTGIILWSRTLCKLQGNPVEELIDTVLLEEKGGEKSATLGPYRLKWDLINEIDVIFVVVYSKLLTLLYVDDLLSNMKKCFLTSFKEDAMKSTCIRIDFDAEFDRALNEAEIKNMQQKKIRNTQNQQPQSPAARLPGLSTQESGSEKASDNEESDLKEDAGADGSEEDDEEETDGVDQNMLAKLQARKSGRKGPTTRKSQSSRGKTVEEAPNSPKKEARVWAGSTHKMSSKTKAALDRSKPSSGGDNVDDIADKDAKELEQSRSIYLPEAGERPMWEVEAEEAKDFEKTILMDDENTTDKSNTSGGWNFGKTYIGDLLQSVTGNKVLEESDLEPVLDKVKEQLQGKNVAQEIADDICSSVGTSLVGHKLASFTRIHTVVTNALVEAVQRVLTPKTSTDILRQVLDAKAEGKVFSAVFVGINGVGKSTSLAKVAYYLKLHGVKVMLAACDTFRSGAVEQLRTHARCLDAPLFEMGYAKDPSRVAAAAIQEAKEKKYDCVLVDTAGRMQNNEPLMRALAKLITENDPNLVLFVGEALVGNDGIDQLSMFDKALVNYSPPGRTNHIDGIVLTKFDTIDDKVGAALSMSYKSGKPIMFVGTGQKYTHLKKLNVNTVIKHLFAN